MLMPTFVLNKKYVAVSLTFDCFS